MDGTLTSEQRQDTSLTYALPALVVAPTAALGTPMTNRPLVAAPTLIPNWLPEIPPGERLLGEPQTVPDSFHSFTTPLPPLAPVVSA